MDGDEGVYDVHRVVDGHSVAEALCVAHVLIEGLTVDVLGDEVPVAGLSFSGPVDLDDVGMIDFPKGADLPAHRVVACGALEQLERSFLPLKLIAHALHPGESALAEDVEHLESPVDHVADCVVPSLCVYR